MLMSFDANTHNSAGSGVSVTATKLKTSFLIGLTLLLSAGFARAFVLDLTGGPAGGSFGGQSATGVDRGSALYSFDALGHEMLVAKTGNRNDDGFPIDDIGFPSVAEDGTIFFATGTFDRGTFFWTIHS